MLWFISTSSIIKIDHLGSVPLYSLIYFYEYNFFIDILNLSALLLK